MSGVPTPRPGRKYTAKQIETMRQAHPAFVMPGHVMRIDADGYTEFVPDHLAVDPWSGKGRALQTAYRSKETIKELFPTEKPRVKRTPQQRVDSMQKHMQDDAQRGGFPGLSEEKVQELVRRAWKRGQPVSADDVRKVAAGMIQEAENKFEASERKKVTRTAPSD